MPPDAFAADNGALTVEQATAELDNEQAQANGGAQDAGDGAQQARPANEEIPSDTTDEVSEAERPGDDETAEGENEAETLKLEPPRWWSKEKKDRFAELPPDLQAVVFEQEETRERVVAKTKQESADARKAADDAKTQYSQKVAVLDQLVPQAAAMFQNRWANVDWAKAATELDPAEYNRVRAQYEDETRTVQRLTKEHEEAQTAQFQQFVRSEAEKLKTVAPDLVDEKLGSQRRTDLGKFLTERGFSSDRINAMSAEEASIAYDAKRWRDAQKRAATLAKQPKTPEQVQAARPNVRPSAAPAAGSPNNATLKSLQAKFDANPSTANLEALMNAQG